MPLRPLILAIALAFGTPMTACAQPQTATGYAMPADGTLLSVSAEASAKRWGQEQTASSAAGAIFGILGLGAIDILILLPIALPVFGTVLSLLIAGVAVFVAGGAVLVVGPFLGGPGGALAGALLGVGLMGLGIFMTGTMALLTKWLIDATVWYARLHYRVVKPALEPQSQA